MTGRNPLITLNNGVEIPAPGLGVFQSAPEETAGAVETALDALDTGVRAGARQHHSRKQDIHGMADFIARYPGVDGARRQGGRLDGEGQ